jgi:aspartyl-tRNA(Asn)/glutamyl-tRNA(Gln) amidotransferase subunit C
MIEHICLIAKLNLTEEEKEHYSKQLSEVLEAFKIIDKVETNEKPSFHPIEIKDKFREDKVVLREWDPLSNAREKEGRYFKGPKII